MFTTRLNFLFSKAAVLLSPPRPTGLCSCVMERVYGTSKIGSQGGLMSSFLPQVGHRSQRHPGGHKGGKIPPSERI